MDGYREVRVVPIGLSILKNMGCYFLSLIVLIYILSSCSHVERATGEITIGVYCGMCKGSCFQGYTISGSTVTRISAKYHDQLQNRISTSTAIEEAMRVKDILKSLPDDLRKYPQTIGCPDCHDQCGVYLSIKNRYGVSVIHIDPETGKHPKEFEAFIAGINSLKLL
ncbi:MAG: hypothetical protein ACXWV4_13175 [Flavitalea sp.]